MIRVLAAALVALGLAACGAQDSTLMVSPEAEHLGGNLYIETFEDGSQALILDGMITPETAFWFRQLTKNSEVAGLLIMQSPGGLLLAGQDIGDLIDKNGINTLVVSSCISACVDVFIAGKERSITETGFLGLHASSEPEVGEGLTAPYWRDHGLAHVQKAFSKVPYDDIWIMDAERAVELRLATEILR